tara:strand:- start:461 stop:601 length:141 start_codon:yes stop_codon:yes gene_type:complete
MEYVHYDDIVSFDEAALDCLSLDALFAEMLIEEETGLMPYWDEEEG